MTTGFSGRLVTIARGDAADPEVFTNIAAIRDTTISFSEESVDVTTKDDGGARCLLAGSVLKSMSVTGTGVFTDNADKQVLSSELLSGTHANYELDLVSTGATDGGAVYTASFRVTALEFAGTYNGEANYSLTLESAGPIAVS